MTAPMPETMSPREKVAQIIKDKVSGPHFTDPVHFVAMEQDRFAAADAILAALASSGDHAELARLADYCRTLVNPGDLIVGPNMMRHALEQSADALEALITENAALRGDLTGLKATHRWNVIEAGEDIRVCDGEHEKWDRCEYQVFVPLTRATEAERKLAEAVGLLRRIDRTYADMQDGNGNHPTELRKIRTFLSKEAERG